MTNATNIDRITEAVERYNMYSDPSIFAKTYARLMLDIRDGKVWTDTAYKGKDMPIYNPRRVINLYKYAQLRDWRMPEEYTIDIDIVNEWALAAIREYNEYPIN